MQPCLTVHRVISTEFSNEKRTLFRKVLSVLINEKTDEVVVQELYLFCPLSFKMFHLYNCTYNDYEGIMSLSQTRVFSTLNLCNLRVLTFNILDSNYCSDGIHSLKYLKSTAMGCKDVGIRKSEFVYL